MLIDLYLQGRFDLDALRLRDGSASATSRLAFDKMHAGDVLRSVVVMAGPA